MSQSLTFLLLMLAGAAICAPCAAVEPKKKPEAEPIPAPKVKIVPSPAAPMQEPTNTRDVWQHYGVNAQGRFVPRVIVLPYGAYYSRNLQPFPVMPGRSTQVLPLKVD
ncbi:MAG: hypothetical protein FJ303_25790 [Planctomycetes bacterium]|nr:hypothetical protein [Planctomycetota bacterium]